MAEHKYAQVMRWIADGETIEWRFDNSKWEPLIGGDVSREALGGLVIGSWIDGYRFRIKPKTVKIGNREVEAPVLNPYCGQRLFFWCNWEFVVKDIEYGAKSFPACHGDYFASKDAAQAAHEAITALLTGKE